MNPTNFKTVIMEEGQSASSSGDCWAVVDTLGFDYMCLEVNSGSHEAAETSLEILRVGESDTAPTDVTTDCTILPAFSCGAAVAATCDNILPPGSSTKQNVYRFNMDLRGRERYISVDYTPVTQVADGLSFIAKLFRANDGDEPLATAATTVDGFRLIANG